MKRKKEHMVIWFILIFCVLNVPENGLDCESFRIISTDFLFVYENKYYLQVYLDSPAHKIVDKQLIDLIIIFILIKIIFLILTNGFYKCCIMIELV